MPTTAPQTATTTTDADACRALVRRIADVTGTEWTFGYIGNCDNHHDDRSWYAFRAHPGRVCTASDHIGGVGTADLHILRHMLRGALAMARTV